MLNNNLVLRGLTFCMLISGCGGERGADKKESQADELMVFCGAGLQPPVAELTEMFARRNKINVATDYAGSQVLISKVGISRSGDVYIPGDKDHVDLAATNGLILSQKPVCYFVPVVFVGKGNPKEIQGVKDLIRPGIKLGLGNPKYIPVGNKAKQIFKKNGIPWLDVESNLKFQSATVNELCLQIQAGTLDAVIIWDAVAHNYSKYGDIVAIPPDQNVISFVEAGVLKFTKNRELAEKFVSFLRSEEGQAVFSKHNYGLAPLE